MSVKIEKISDNRYEVNGKLIFKNMDGKWVCPSLNDLTPNEEKVFNQHLNAEKLNLKNRLN